MPQESHRGATPFSRFIRTLDSDRFHPSILGIGLVLALLAAWFLWLLRASIPVYEVTERARLEVDRALHPIEALVAGRVVGTHMSMGQDVREGDVLIELDSDAERRQLDVEQAKLRSLTPRIAAVRGEAAAEERALAQSGDAAGAHLDEARAQHREAEAAARFAEVEAERQARLHRGGLLAEVDLLRAQSDSERRRATAESLAFAVRRHEREQQTNEADRKVRLERLKKEEQDLEGERAAAAAAVVRLGNEIERRLIRAPVSGPLAEVATLRIGAVLRQGDRLGAVVPPGRLRAVAEFPPGAALGRIHAGQTARLRLEGFPWAEYGMVPAVVEGVAGEIRDGRVRVELAVDGRQAPRIPLQHGLPGTAEVEVERVSPADLVLRAAGRILALPTARGPVAPETNP
jgi:membrane fusion protein (multidrug efflux system)